MYSIPGFINLSSSLSTARTSNSNRKSSEMLCSRFGVRGCSRPGRAQSVRAHASSATVAERLTFANDKSGFSFAPIVNGCWQLAGGHGREVFDGIEEKLAAHAAAGFTTFDTADIYGPSEQILGQFARQWRESGKQPVEIFTKYVPNIFNSRPTPSSVEAAVRKSCAALQVKQLELVQMHWWDYGIPGMEDAAKALADCQAKGLIRNVGTTNMDCQALERIMDAGVPVVVNQVQFSLLDRRPLNGMVQLAKERGVKLLTYGSVAGGLLSDKHVISEPKSGMFGQVRYPNVDLNTSSLKMYWNVARMFGGQELWRELLVAMRSVADRHPGATVANVALAWVMAQGATPIVGLRSAAHIEDNAKALALKLTPQDMAQLDEVLRKAKGPAGDIYSFERGG